MVAASNCPGKAQLNNRRKASKPLMEKKRRARINECLDELKSLMESYYTNYIRKRKMEKADILEMTVKHIRNLQKIQQDLFQDAKCLEFQAGFKSCMNGVNQFFLKADSSSDTLRMNVLRNLSGFNRMPSMSSTADSDTEDRAHFRGLKISLRTNAEQESDKDCRTTQFLNKSHISIYGNQQQLCETGAETKSETQLRSFQNDAHAVSDLRFLKDCLSTTSSTYWRPW